MVPPEYDMRGDPSSSSGHGLSGLQVQVPPFALPGRHLAAAHLMSVGYIPALALALAHMGSLE